MYNLVDDLAVLTTIPAGSINKLVEKAALCICNDLEESLLNNEDLTSIDMGLGTLQIMFSNNELKFRFIPNRKLEAAARDTVLNKKNPLVDKVEQTLAQRITNAYKNFI